MFPFTKGLFSGTFFQPLPFGSSNVTSPFGTFGMESEKHQGHHRLLLGGCRAKRRERGSALGVFKPLGKLNMVVIPGHTGDELYSLAIPSRIPE